MKKKEDSNRFGVMDDTEMVEELKEFLERSQILDEQAKTDKGLSYNPLPEKGGYIEPPDYFSEETRKKYKLGEYAEGK